MLFLLYPPNYLDKTWHAVYSAGRCADSIVTQLVNSLEQLRAWFIRTNQHRIDYLTLRHIQRRTARYRRKIRIRQAAPNLVAWPFFAIGWLVGSLVQLIYWLRDALSVGYRLGRSGE